MVQCIGGYSDYLSQKKSTKKDLEARENKTEEPNSRLRGTNSKILKPKKLTYKLKYELDNLPKKIEKVEKDIETFSAKLAEPDFYNSDPEGFVVITKKLEKAKINLEYCETRWLELEELSMS